MARRGRFGRAPRSAPSITNTLVAIAREMQNQRDQNLMDAWSKGGMFEGKPATDEAVLAHWRARLEKVDKADPLYDTYKNTITQYEYSIAESKMSTEYAQGKVSDLQMANFYLNWSKKVPRDSEFYRVLQRDGAQFMRAARAKGAANAKKAQEEAYNASQTSIHQKYEAAGEYLLNTLRTMAQQSAVIGGPGSGSDFTDFDPTDPGKMIRLLDLISVGVTPGGGRAPGSAGEIGNADVLFHDPITGEAITGEKIAAQLQALDPTFDGRVNLNYLHGILKQQMTGIQQRIDLAESTGHASDVNALKKAQSYVAELGREAAAWPIEQDYMNLRAYFEKTWASPYATPDQKMLAFEEYTAGLTKLATDPRIATDDNTVNRLLAEANGTAGVPSLYESFNGLQNFDGRESPASDIGETFAAAEQFQTMRDAVADGSAFWTTGVYNSAGVFVPAVGGPAIGAADLNSIKQVSPVVPKVIFVPQGGGASTIPVVVSGGDVTVTATDALGNPINSVTNKNPIASVYQVAINGQSMRVYGYQANDGRTYYTTDTPWDDRLNVRQVDGGLKVDVSPLVPADPLAQTGPGWTTDVKYHTDGSKTTTLIMDPAGVALNSDPSRTAAGPDPATDFFSPTLAALTSLNDGGKVLAELAKDQAFQQQLQFEAQQAAIDPQTGQVDQGKLAMYNGQVQFVTNIPSYQQGVADFIAQAATLWNRVTTEPTFGAVAGKNPNVQASSGGAQLSVGGKPVGGPLPADQVSDTPFSPLGNIFQLGTNLLKPVADAFSDALKITTSGTIKLPEAPQPSMTPTPTPTPTTTTVSPNVPTYTPPKQSTGGVPVYSNPVTGQPSKNQPL